MTLSGRPFLLAGALVVAIAGGSPSAAERPNVLLISVDTLRADHLGVLGYERNTSPHIDRLLEASALFTEARTVEPLTAPALASMLTSLEPHEHGSTRNGLAVRPNLASFSRILGRRGYQTAAFVGNWTLRDRFSGLGEHFETYVELLTKSRYLFWAREATAEDLTDGALDWLDDREPDEAKPFLLWVHYVEPHAPYKLHREVLPQLGLAPGEEEREALNRYDSEIAFVDREVHRLLSGVLETSPPERTLVIFVSDHGESLGEHAYWGHGRHVYDATLRIPMGIHWPGRIAPRRLDAPALITDLAPTILGLVGLEIPEFFGGFDWSPVLVDGAAPPAARVTYHQSHKGAVAPGKEDTTRPRQKGLLEVARIEGGRKEALRVTNSRRRVFDLRDDPDEGRSLVDLRSAPSADLLQWLEVVRAGLVVADDLPPPSLSEEDVEALRALGYLD